MANKIKIELTEEEANLFKWFRKYQHIWEEVFKIKAGNTTLHFDEHGELREVEYKYKNKIKTEKT